MMMTMVGVIVPNKHAVPIQMMQAQFQMILIAMVPVIQWIQMTIMTVGVTRMKMTVAVILPIPVPHQSIPIRMEYAIH